MGRCRVDADCDGNDDDADGDGAGRAVDCDDADPAVNTSAEEICYDGVDQDCSGGSDFDADGDGFLSSAWGGDDCDDARAQTFTGAAEVCNGVDDNCDGSPDEGFDVGAACTSGVGSCGATGTIACRPDGTATCDAAPGAPSAESCDGLDNDCNGRVDDTGATETCDGADNDCDGVVDEGFGVGDACSVGQGACRAEGVVACAEGGQAACAATAGAPPTSERVERSHAR
jgi:hypothetical protein